MTARHTLRRTALTVLPVTMLAVTASVGVLTVPTADPTRRAAPVSYANGNPIGKISFTKVPGGVRLKGWAFDPSKQRTKIRVVATVSGRTVRSATARNTKTLPRAYRKAGTRHGFDFRTAVPEGVRTVCVVAKDIGRGRDTRLGCLRRATFDYGPFGGFSTATRPGHVVVGGWFVDNDRPTAPITTRVVVDGVARTLVADARRSYVARANPGAGAAHGFSLAVPVAQGRHSVCVSARNIGVGSSNAFPCRTVVLNDNPLGELSVGQRDGKLRVAGFAVDRDRPTTPLAVTMRVDNGAPVTVTANTVRNKVAKKYAATPAHGFDRRFTAAEGAHTVCVTVANLGYGADKNFGCRTVTLNYAPTVRYTAVTQHVEGMAVRGWAADPDTDAATTVRLTLTDVTSSSVVATRTVTTAAGHNFTATLPTRSGSYRVCAVAVNQVSGTHDSTPVCRALTLTLSPVGRFDSIGRVGNNVRITGWAFDADTAAPVAVEARVDGGTPVVVSASQSRPDVAKVYPSAGSARGFAPVLTTNDGKHTVCVTLRNVGGGASRSLGCKLAIAVHPKVPSVPRNATAVSGYNSLRVSWTPPANDGGAPPTNYRVLIRGQKNAVYVPATARTATVTGLARKTTYTVYVGARNVAGWSASAVIARATTQAGPGPQTTTPPISVSRYMRNIRTCNTAEFTEMRGFGRSDARSNPSGHRYLQLLDIGGQTSRYGGGVMLSAIVRYVSYPALLRCSRAYVDGYASGMRANAPAMIAMGVNNDLDVSKSTGQVWATKIVNPLSSYSRRYAGITIAGANDIEPGFSASYGATRNWLTGYLGATSAPFVFNGSADGCAWTVTGRRCNNGWTMAGLYNLAGGMAPKRTINLPQIYNYTMADQWKYISLTGVAASKPRINFGGPLTEVKACAQARSCNSIGGRSAWLRLWRNLQSHRALKVGSLPYATDLRIDS